MLFCSQPRALKPRIDGRSKYILDLVVGGVLDLTKTSTQTWFCARRRAGMFAFARDDEQTKLRWNRVEQDEHPMLRWRCVEQDE